MTANKPKVRVAKAVAGKATKDSAPTMSAGKKSSKGSRGAAVAPVGDDNEVTESTGDIETMSSFDRGYEEDYEFDEDNFDRWTNPTCQDNHKYNKSTTISPSFFVCHIQTCLSVCYTNMCAV